MPWVDTCLVTGQELTVDWTKNRSGDDIQKLSLSWGTSLAFLKCYVWWISSRVIEQCILNSNGWKSEDGTSAVIIGDLGGAIVCGNLADRKKEAINIDVQNLTVTDLHASINYHQNTSWAILIASKTLYRVNPPPYVLWYSAMNKKGRRRRRSML
jgi:hypothetical protein